jgi:excisionase family DNA binding protein
MEKYMSFYEIAERLGVPARTVYHLNAVGRGPKCSKIGRAYRVSERSFAEWLAENEQ